VTQLVEELVAAWGRGERPRAEAFLARYPGLCDQPEAAIRLIYEEVCLRQDEGEEATLSELVRRFPRWRTELAVLLDCDRLVGAGPRPPAFPAPGETLGEFVLLAELGRGARGRCFLAVQPCLADRAVVLKLAPGDQGEHLSLARLQHTHIMPLYSEQEFPARGLRALCMPYLGGATLGQILAALRDLPPVRRTGQSLLEVLDRAQVASPLAVTGRGPARQFLAQASYAQAVCWIGVCIADALHYAHDRGLVHMDVKPSNVLLTADAQPMLLDFHLARQPIDPGELPCDGLGGTPGYMSPEQEAMVASVRTGGPSLAGVDARSDLYSLAVVLSEMLGETDSTGPRAGSPRAIPFIPQVSPGLRDLIRKCLAPDPRDRYANAASLADDLRRHLADQPLRGVRNRSLSERWRKWCRRRPDALSRAKLLLAATSAALAVVALAWWLVLAPRFRQAEHALREGKVLWDRRRYPEALRALTRGAALIEDLPGNPALARELAEQLRRTHRAQTADRLHGLVERLRFLESAAPRPPRALGEVEQHCQVIWESRRSIVEALGEGLDRDREQRARTDLLDLAIIWASLRVRNGRDATQADTARRQALRTLDEAEALFGPSHVLFRERRAHAEALGLLEVAATAARGAAQVPPRTAWEHDAVGRSLLASGDLVPAEAAFERALALRPQDFWPNFHQGVCAFRQGHYQDAVSAFRVCIALAPDRAECFYNRALAYAALGQTPKASWDYDRAGQLDPSLALPTESRTGFLPPRNP
jgi:serine/threonine protein kinase